MTREEELLEIIRGNRRQREKPNGNGHDVGEHPTILVEPGERPRAAREGLAAMQAAHVPFFRRYTDLVRVARIEAKDPQGNKLHVPAAIIVGPTVAAEALSDSAVWEKRTKKGTATIDPPAPVVAHVLAMIEAWPFPVLRGITATPTLRPNGSLLAKRGYDEETGLYLFEPPAMPPIPADPSREDALAARDVLNGLLEEFCFADEGVSRSAALAMLMTPVLRGAMDVAPMFVVTKPEAGTGGSYLQHLASMIATGERAPVISLTPNPEENEKRLAAAALSQQPLIALDNVSIDLGGDFLCQVTEQSRLRIRRLGASEMVIVDNSFTVFANGNQLQTTGDVVRRTIRIELDANMENPDARTFKRDPLAEVKEDRGRYIAAILTIARAYAVQGFPDEKPPKPSYEAWSRIVRSAITWLGWPDPVAGIEELRAADPIRSARAILFEAWIDYLEEGASYTTSEIITWAKGDSQKAQNLREALIDVAKARTSNEPDPMRLAHWLSKNLNTVAHKHKLVVDRGDKKRPKWALVPNGGSG